MIRRILKRWEICVLAVFVCGTVIAASRETYRGCYGTGSVDARYFDQYDWGVDDASGLFIARWATFGRHNARSENGFWRVGLQFGDEYPESGNGWWWRVRVPLWLLLLFMAPAAVRWASIPLRWLHSLRPKPGCCRTCGYDLRATPERCPECGTVTNQVD